MHVWGKEGGEVSCEGWAPLGKTVGQTSFVRGGASEVTFGALTKCHLVATEQRPSLASVSTSNPLLLQPLNLTQCSEEIHSTYTSSLETTQQAAFSPQIHTHSFISLYEGQYYMYTEIFSVTHFHCVLFSSFVFWSFFFSLRTRLLSDQGSATQVKKKRKRRMNQEWKRRKNIS